MPRMMGSVALAGAVLGAFLALVGAWGLARLSRRDAMGQDAVTAGWQSHGGDCGGEVWKGLGAAEPGRCRRGAHRGAIWRG